MTTDQIISASSSVGTFLAAIATFMTITQISRQRRASYQPDLAFSRVDFEASNDKSSLPLGWKKPKTQDDLRLSLINLGLGAAKNVWLRWSFPIDESVRQITQLGKQPPFDAPSAFLLDDQLIINLEHTKIVSNWRDQRSQYLDYVVPIASEQTPRLVRLPEAYMLAVSAIVFFAIKAEKNFLSLLPSLAVDLQFDDIAGSRHRTALRYDVDISLIKRGADDFHFLGSLEVNRPDLPRLDSLATGL